MTGVALALVVGACSSPDQPPPDPATDNEVAADEPADDEPTEEEPAEDDAADAAGSQSEPDTPTGAAEEPPAGEAEPLTGEDAAAAEEPAEDSADQADSQGNGGVGEHRPPTTLDVDAECAAITDPPPGALILFPDNDDPATLQAGPGPVLVEIVGCSETFEANLQYDAYHGTNTNPTLQGATTGGTLGIWEAFSIEETFWTPGDWTVVVFEIDAQTGNRVDHDQVTFTVN